MIFRTLVAILSILTTTANITSAVAGVIDLRAVKIFPDRSHVRVCFASDQGWSKPYQVGSKGMTAPDEFKKTISEAILTNFSLALTGIQYEFIGDCGENPDEVEAVVVYSKTTFGETHFSTKQEPEYFPPGVSKPYIVMGATLGMPKGYIHEVAIHEFGHLSGLAHETLRAEVLNDRNCRYLEKSTRSLLKRFGLWGNLIGPTADYLPVGAYDRESRMNYCYESIPSEEANMSKATLSAEDRNTLLYIASEYWR